MRFWGQTFFQDAASSTILQLVKFHDHAMLILALVFSVVAYAIFSLCVNNFSCRRYLKEETLEECWTYFPAVLLIALGYPSLELLYRIEETGSPSLTIKALGHQWYWRYEYSDFSDIELDAYIIPADDLNTGDYRLLETDHRVCLPFKIQTRVVVTSIDVIHSWAIPSMGVKVDAIPGRLNQVVLQPNRYGVFYGICSEICGANHAFMPIVVEVVPPVCFKEWKERV